MGIKFKDVVETREKIRKAICSIMVWIMTNG